MFLMRIWNRLNTFCFIRYAYFLTGYARTNTAIYCHLYILNTVMFLMNLSLQKNTDLTRFFIIKPRHPGRLKKQIWVEKTCSGRPGHMRKNAYCRRPNLKWTFEDLLPCHCYAIKINSRTIRLQHSHPASAGKGADMSELQSHHCMTPEHGTRLLCGVNIIPGNKLSLQQLNKLIGT